MIAKDKDMVSTWKCSQCGEQNRSILSVCINCEHKREIPNFEGLQIQRTYHYVICTVKTFIATLLIFSFTGCVQDFLSSEYPALSTTTTPSATSTHTVPPTMIATITITAPPTQTPDQVEKTPDASATQEYTATAHVTQTPTPIGGGSGRLAYFSDKLYFIDLNSLEVEEIQSGHDFDLSQDGKFIAFDTYAEHSLEIFIFRVSDNSLIRLTNNFSSDAYPACSPDMTQIAFISFDRVTGGIYRIDLDGSNLTQLVHYPGFDDPGYDSVPRWSPDGDQILYTRDRQLFMVNADGSEHSAVYNLYWPNFVEWENYAWSPDGSSLLYIGFYAEYLDIFVMDLRSGERTNLTNNRAHDHAPTWSPDGTMIAYTSEIDGNEEIYIMNADGSEKTNLSNHPAADNYPIWSPDGNYIAFNSNRGNNWNVYFVRIDGNDLTQVTEKMEYEFIAFWLP